MEYVNQIKHWFLAENVLTTVNVGDFSLNITLQIVSIAAFSLIVLLFLSLLLCCKKTKQPTVGIIGLSDSGKTVLYFQMKHGKFVETQTSMVENEGLFPIAIDTDKRTKKNIIHFIDFPGASRLRGRFYHNTHFDELTALVFVVDISTFRSQLHDIAIFIVDLLVNVQLSENKIPLLIAFNKIDLLKSTKNNENEEDEEEDNELNEYINALEEEIFAIRKSRASVTGHIKTHSAIPSSSRGSLLSRIFCCCSGRSHLGGKKRSSSSSGSGDSDEGNEDLEALGDLEEPFRFDELNRTVRFCRCSAKEAQCGDLIKQIQKIK
ncbi:SRb, signal recognition particle receptor beta subunit [Monocercomonoides exilis]|uniref:SRb, signal recognition particle receptor beta subunit n=1 Tax=Monocercomonoides exilis TaxID=2049356 RepID=UPI00355AB885|nr:SRb, signal recognition particle receptor beta subunit [Monocercomonoides exilis]|eukprot:MONOS_7399.1-p1 / transcript=MONOS_7399.1 / gene=MONOS_7399 / organism=Monocercomonoides_exilis_PA203 / gene_product=SRb, signal recognition particle receptor beta subunit / transcript_product=SRb, signal recognition particle receptor beta subunit / location=Mono_scaffold00251:70813-72229(-) / protein_length=321 / sequence_SO=supercontig / SO=protein_coding / is_pseudo=false